MKERTPGTFAAISDREQGLQRTLSARQLSMIAIGGAIGTGLFLGSGFAIGFAGPSVLISYLVGAFITLLLMGCMAEMTVAHPTAGSFGAWAEFYVSPLAGFLLRYAYWAGVVLAVGTEVSAVAIYMHYWFPVVPGWEWTVLFSFSLVLLNAFNVRFFGAFESALSALKVAAILLFLCLGTWVVVTTASGALTKEPAVGFINYTANGGFFPHGFTGTWIAVLVSLFSFFSIEMIAVAAGEAKDPQRAITHAFRATMLRLVLFYVLTLALILAIVPWTTIASGSAESPFVTVMRRTHIPAAAGVVNFVILVAALSAMNSQLYITARMMFSLSRAGFAPRTLGRLTLQGVPLPALLASTVGIALATLLNLWFHERAFLLMLAISMFGPLFTWLMIFVNPPAVPQATSARATHFRMWGYPYTSLLGAGLMLAALVTTMCSEAFRPTLLYGVPFLILLSVAYAFIRPRAGEQSQATIEESLSLMSLNTSAGSPSVPSDPAGSDPLLRWRAEFPILQTTTYMISHSLGPMPRRTVTALQEFTDTWAARGIRAWQEGWWDMPLTCGDLIGSIIGAPEGRVVMHQNVSICQTIVTSCFDWSGPRNRLVTDGLNFPSNDYIYHGLERQGAEIVSVASTDGMTVPLEAILAAIDDRTQLVSISHVAFRSSYVQDLAAITKRAHEVGAYIVADVYQSAGIVPLDVVALNVDFATGGSVKWLLGGPGAGYLYVREDLDPKLQPAATGWAAHAHPFEFETGSITYAADMRRFLNGTPNVPAMYSARIRLRDCRRDRRSSDTRKVTAPDTIADRPG